MAAKLEQPISPSFNRMISLLPESQRHRLTKEELVELEEKIVLAFEFDFHYASPVTFLERYQRLFSVDQEDEDEGTKQIGYTARQFLKYMQRNHEFLEFTPSQQAAAALTLAINLSYSPASEFVGLKRIGEKFSPLYVEEFLIPIDSDIDEKNSIFNLKPEESDDPLAIWSTRVSNLT